MILAHVPIDDGPHNHHALPSDELDNPLPSCAPCSAEWSKQHFHVPGRVRVDRSLLIRDLVGRRYLAVVHCHGASELVDFGEELPTNRAIAARVAFRSRPHGK